MLAGWDASWWKVAQPKKKEAAQPTPAAAPAPAPASKSTARASTDAYVQKHSALEDCDEEEGEADEEEEEGPWALELDALSNQHVLVCKQTGVKAWATTAPGTKCVLQLHGNVWHVVYPDTGYCVRCDSLTSKQ
eukprot:13555974-Alexandrium_andersonii.AAC.1